MTSGQWRAVPGYEGAYEVSDLGQVRSVDRTMQTIRGPWRYRGQALRSSQAAGTGYLTVHLTEPATLSRRTEAVHVLVLTAFRGPRPVGMQGCHNDGDRTNNFLGNLRWDSPSANSQDTLRHGHHREAAKTHCPAGHAYDEVNVSIGRRSDGHTFRRCRVCLVESTRRSRERKRAAA